MRTTNLKSIVWKEEKYFISQCLEVEVSSFGTTKKQAIKNLQDALALYFQDAPIPKKQRIQNLEIKSVSFEHA